jgi:hypothetical protein
VLHIWRPWPQLEQNVYHRNRWSVSHLIASAERDVPSLVYDFTAPSLLFLRLWLNCRRIATTKYWSPSQTALSWCVMGTVSWQEETPSTDLCNKFGLRYYKAGTTHGLVFLGYDMQARCSTCSRGSDTNRFISLDLKPEFLDYHSPFFQAYYHSYCHDLVVVWLLKRDFFFGLDTGIFWRSHRLQYFITIYSKALSTLLSYSP